ncbi:hypothetical protein ACGE24_09360 [Corynebacterium kroppenstedtii]|uniref:hypothetical protein n=1 Tax=Corynebacterium sp. PCR 32 TaxID=3351342 RepID=UPI0030A2468C
MRWPHTICLASGTRVFVRPDGLLQVGADRSTAVVIPMTNHAAAHRVARALLTCTSPRTTASIIDRVKASVSHAFALTLIDELLRTSLVIPGNVEPGRSRASIPPPHTLVATGAFTHVLADMFPSHRILTPALVERQTEPAAHHRDTSPTLDDEHHRSEPRASIVAGAVPSPALLSRITKPYMFITVHDGALRVGPTMVSASTPHSCDENFSGCPLCMHIATVSPELADDVISAPSASTPTLTHEMYTVASGIITAQWSALNDWLTVPSLPVPPTIGASISLNPRTMEVSRREIPRHPRCPVCSSTGPRWP